MNVHKVSIICPVFNEEKYIDRCIQSITEQDYPLDSREVLFIDGRSTDRTREIIEGYIKDNPYIRLLDNPQQVVPFALNKGIEESSGEVLMRIDGHCTYPTNYVSELVKYLYDNDFIIYVVSGTERTTTRAIVANSPIKDYVSPAHVIGTEFEVKLKGSEDISSNMDFKYANGDELVFTGGFIQKNLNANKTIWIEREIGQQPVLCFGNSSGDGAMANYTITNNRYRSGAYLLCCDDLDRENGNIEKADKMRASCEENGWTAVSMKDDWTTIYGDGVTRH